MLQTIHYGIEIAVAVAVFVSPCHIWASEQQTVTDRKLLNNGK
jgi:hypothetical protein